MQGGAPHPTPLQQRIHDLYEGFRSQDEIAGNGGADVIKALDDFFRHEPPVAEFGSVEQYLDYRYDDVAMS